MGRAEIGRREGFNDPQSPEAFLDARFHCPDSFEAPISICVNPLFRISLAGSVLNTGGGGCLYNEVLFVRVQAEH